jgi:HSP20 family protein
MKHDVTMGRGPAKRPIRNLLANMTPRGERLAEQVETLWNHIYNDTRSIFMAEEPKHIHPRIDILENKNIYTIRVDLPGVDANTIDLHTEGKTLSLKAKRACAEIPDFKMSHCEHVSENYEREIQLADDAVIEEKSATLADGVLSIRVPRKAA